MTPTSITEGTTAMVLAIDSYDPMTMVTPFTARENVTYLQKVNASRDKLNELISHSATVNQELIDKINADFDSLEVQWNAELLVVRGEVIEQLSTPGTPAYELIVSVAGDVYDPATAGLVENDSETRAALRASFAAKDSAYALASSFGVVGDGVVDDTVALNNLLSAAAANGLGVQLAPNSVVRVSSLSGLVLPTGTRFNLNGSTLKMAIDNSSARLLHIEGVNDVVLFNGRLDGNLAEYEPATEQRHNVRIVNSDHVTLRDIVSVNAKGDGIYVGDDIVGKVSNLVLDRVTADKNHRQGMSVTAVDGLTAIACVFSGTSGTAPQAGVDIEPNTDTAMIRGIKMLGCVFTDNATQGLIVSTRANATAPQNGGEYVGCSFDGNTLDGVYLNNGSNATFSGGTIKNNGRRGVWFSSATSGRVRNVKFSGVDIVSNGSKGVLTDQPFDRLAFIGCNITNNVGIGVDCVPVAGLAPSSGLRFIGNTTGNTAGVTTQTHGIRTGANVTRFTCVANSPIDNVTGSTSLADEVATRLLMDSDSKPVVTGSRGGNTTLTSLLTGLSSRGFIIDNSTV